MGSNPTPAAEQAGLDATDCCATVQPMHNLIGLARDFVIGVLLVFLIGGIGLAGRRA